MPIDVALLATTLVSSFLLPYVKMGAEKIAEEVTGKLGKGAAEHVTGVASKVWDRVKSVFSSDTDKATLTQFEKYPEQARDLIIAVLQEKLEQDRHLAQELAELVDSPGPDGRSTTGAQIMRAGIAGIVDLRQADFSRARGINITAVNQGTPPSPTSPESDLPEETS